MTGGALGEFIFIFVRGNESDVVFFTRFEDAILNGCVPVVVMDDVAVAWEGYLDVQSLSIRHPRSEMHSLVETLRSIPPERVTALRVAGAKSWHR